ncbi:MAG: hypothetical protein O3C21_08040 [Verrucomicrobia bacterium]|nr:hypothetical protein [Verrucomicrobiota bacterium]
MRAFLPPADGKNPAKPAASGMRKGGGCEAVELRRGEAGRRELARKDERTLTTRTDVHPPCLRSMWKRAFLAITAKNAEVVGIPA